MHCQRLVRMHGSRLRYSLINRLTGPTEVLRNTDALLSRTSDLRTAVLSRVSRTLQQVLCIPEAFFLDKPRIKGSLQADLKSWSRRGQQNEGVEERSGRSVYVFVFSVKKSLSLWFFFYSLCRAFPITVWLSFEGVRGRERKQREENRWREKEWGRERGRKHRERKKYTVYREREHGSSPPALCPQCPHCAWSS